MIRPLGFGLAFGVLFDAFVVRMLIVPGAHAPARRRPRGGCRSGSTASCPNVDIEGAALERRHPGTSSRSRRRPSVEADAAAAPEPEAAVPGR